MACPRGLAVASHYNMITVKVEGLKELQAALEAKPHNIARKLLRRAMRAAANIWREEISRTAPRLDPEKVNAKRWARAANKAYLRPGHLAASIGLREWFNSKEMQGGIEVGPGKSAFYAKFLEFGTRKMAARPFIRPAFERLKQSVLDRFVEEGKKIVSEEARSKT